MSIKCAHWDSDHMCMQEVSYDYYSCWVNVHFTVLTLDIYLCMLIMKIFIFMKLLYTVHALL